MVFVIMAVGIFWGLFWIGALFFATRTKSTERSVAIPGVWTLIFGLIAGFGGMKWAESKESPELLTKEKYTSLKADMTLTDVVDILGQQPVDMSGKDEVELERYDLTSNRIRMPGEVSRRLPPGLYLSERTDAELTIVIDPDEDAEVSKRGAVNKSLKENETKAVLGSSAIIDERKKQGHGLQGLVIRFYVEDAEATAKLTAERNAEYEANKDKEDFELPPIQPVAVNGQEWIFTEGVDWTYADEATPDQVADALAKAIDAHPSFSASYVFDEDALVPNSDLKVTASYCLVEGTKDDDCAEDKINPLAGKAGNVLKAQVMTGKNYAVRLGRSVDGSYQSFFGGSDEVSTAYFEEDEPWLDDDFSNTPRLIVAGFISKKLVALGQNGLEMTKDEEPLPVVDATAQASAQ